MLHLKPCVARGMSLQYHAYARGKNERHRTEHYVIYQHELDTMWRL